MNSSLYDNIERRRIHPSDGIVLALLLLAVTVAVVRLETVGAGLLGVHVLLLAFFATASWLFTRYKQSPVVGYLRPLVTVCVVFTLYTTLGKLGFAAMPYLADGFLSHADQWLLGFDPSLAIQPLQSPGRVEFFSFVYGAFIPYIYLSLLLNCLGRAPGERDVFLTGWVLTYAISFLGYLFLPAHGPVVYHAADYDVALQGGMFYRAVLAGVEAGGGPHGAFPSLHIGCSVYFCLFDLKSNRLRGLTYLPIVLLIYVSTVFLRYHYVVDLIAGTIIASSCIWLTRRARKGTGSFCASHPKSRSGKRGPSPFSAYRLFRALSRTVLGLFFRRVDVEGRENVPETRPVLFVANHSNALVDPLVLVNALDRQVTVTAKNVLSKNPLLGFLIRALGVITFHRQQDVGQGAELRKNVESLRQCRKRLASGGAVCIFPEGVSHSDPHMRPFLAGPARLAMDFVRKNADAGDLTIIPVGLSYTEKDRFRSSVWLRFGSPLSAREWVQQNPDGKPADLTTELRRQIEHLTVNFETRRESLVLTWAADIVATGADQPESLGSDETSVAERFRLLGRLQDGYRRLLDSAGEELESLSTRIRKYRSELKRRGIAPAEVYLRLHLGRATLFVVRELELFVVGAPLALFGILHHLIPYCTVRAVARKLSTDKDHWASNVVYPSFVIFPLYYAAVGVALCLFLPPLWAVLYGIVILCTGLYAILYAERTGGAVRRARTFTYFFFNREKQEELAAEGREILESIRALRARLEDDDASADDSTPEPSM